MGKLLVATPTVKGFWAKTCILITDQEPNGLLGIITNKPSPSTLREFGREMDTPLAVKGYLQLGGPMNTNWLSLLHTSEWTCSHTERISEKFSISSAEEILPRLSRNDRPQYWRLLLGLYGWLPHQLWSEIEGTSENTLSWCIIEPTIELLFKSNGQQQWKLALEQVSQEFSESYLVL